MPLNPKLSLKVEKLTLLSDGVKVHYVKDFGLRIADVVLTLTNIKKNDLVVIEEQIDLATSELRQYKRLYNKGDMSPKSMARMKAVIVTLEKIEELLTDIHLASLDSLTD